MHSVLYVLVSKKMPKIISFKNLEGICYFSLLIKLWKKITQNCFQNTEKKKWNSAVFCSNKNIITISFFLFSWYIAVGTFEIKCQNKFGAYLSGAIKSDVVMLQYCLTLFRFLLRFFRYTFFGEKTELNFFGVPSDFL